ncbi:glutamate receptor [Senna tora]|uniref:Glutamate receptor n=1 Tax=Senna tora TaxID=362788 RepID=A0A835CKD9_9FABA|nr:glutamate receptor [Senna tora]
MKMDKYLGKMKTISDQLALAGAQVVVEDRILHTLIGHDIDYNAIIVKLNGDASFFNRRAQGSVGANIDQAVNDCIGATTTFYMPKQSRSRVETSNMSTRINSQDASAQQLRLTASETLEPDNQSAKTPQVAPLHHMTTRSRDGIFKPKQPNGGLVEKKPLEQCSYSESRSATEALSTPH